LIKKITDRLAAGEGLAGDPALLKNVADNIAGRTICAFGEACAWPVQSFVAKFPEEFAERARSGAGPGSKNGRAAAGVADELEAV
jgi:NADH-quinone oxidoreductase subunit F